jgi:hypothetical protein
MNYFIKESGEIYAYADEQMDYVAENDIIAKNGLTPISEEEALKILNPPPTKEQRIETALAELESEKEAALKTLKVEYNGASYDADERSQMRISGAVTLLTLAPAGTAQTWIDADNTPRSLTLGDLAAIGALIAAKVTEITVSYRAKKDAAIADIEAEFKVKK